jgi:hypothetical protein
MNNRFVHDGYILMLTLMLLTIGLAITTYLFNTGTVHTIYARTITEREKARNLALSGIQIALSQLHTIQKEKKDDTAEKLNAEQQLLMTVVPVLNRWQRFNLVQESDGIDGQMGVCISSEDGKFNINSFYDFERKKFIGENQLSGDMKQVAQDIFKRLKEFVHNKDLFPAFEKCLKERGKPLQDVTQLLSQKEFAVFKDTLFYAPPTEQEKEKRGVYLMDIFTVESRSAMLEPWLLSDSCVALYGLMRAQSNDIKKRKEMMQKMIRELKKNEPWATAWNRVLKPLYGKDFNHIPTLITALLTQQFEPSTFSVLSYGKVGTVTCYSYAILERVSEKKSSIPFVVKKIFLI